MSKKLLKFSLAMVAAMLPIAGALAQIPENEKVQPQFPDLQNAMEKAQAKKALEAKHPLLFKEKTLIQRYSAFPNASLPIKGVIEKPKKAFAPLRAYANTTIWANLANKEGWNSENFGPFGYYSFAPVSPLDFTLLYETTAQDVAKNGLQYVDGHIYGLNIDMTYSTRGQIYEFLYDTNTSTGETSQTQLDYYSQQNLAATETAQADDGTVYGEFYNADGTGFELGTVDYTTLTRSTISTLSNLYVALGITKEGQLYGIALDGNLYKIDKTTGEETVVGPTGITIDNGSGSYYGQSGEIDQKDNTFYWAAVDGSGNCGFYIVDLNTGAATKIDGGNNQLYGMIIPSPEAADGAPAKVTDVAVTFNQAEHTGVITFKMPTTTFSGTDLSGNLNYNVYEGDSVIASGTAVSGEAVEKSIHVEKDGSHTFIVRAANDAGESPKVKVTTWVGYDTPSPVTNVKAVVNGDSVSLTWDASTTGIHGGYVGTPIYNIYYVDGGNYIPVAENVTSTSYIDHVTDSNLKYYTYAVTASSNNIESAYTTSNGIVLGKAIEPDWTETFDNGDDWNLFTVLDANNDGCTWSWSDFDLAASSFYSSSNGNDDWLFTPPIHLTSGRLYTISFKATNQYNFQNSLEVKWGRDKTPEAMTSTLLATSIPSSNNDIYSYDIDPTEDGNYYIGFHDNTTQPDQFYLLVDSIVVEKGALGTAPAAVTDLTVTPDSKGALSAVVSFNVPTANVKGNTIDKVDSIQISRDGEHIATLSAANAGEHLTYTDNAVPSNGSHRYVVTPYIGSDFGQRANATVFIGQDAPAAPKNVTLADNESDVLAKWDVPSETGAKGGYVNPSDISVSFYKLEQGVYGDFVGDSLTQSAKGATSAEIPQNPVVTTAEDGTTQALYQLAAYANGAGGRSEYSKTGTLIVGAPLKTPYKESFANGSVDNRFMWMDGNEQYMNNNNAAGWNTTSRNSADADGGSVVWTPYTMAYWYGNVDYTITPGDEVSINTPKVSVSGLSNPKLYFELYAIPDDPAQLKVTVQTPDGVDHEAKTYDLSATSEAGWTTESIDLGRNSSERYVIVKFRGIASGSNTTIGIDNINIFDQLAYNLMAVGISAPSSVTAGKSGKANVTVENFGANTASDYSIVLYEDNEPVDTVIVSDKVGVLDQHTTTLEFPVAINQTEPITLNAKVIYGSDLNTEDNATKSVSVYVDPSKYSAVNDLQAADTKDGVSLSWTRPVSPAPEEVTEDFESYEPFATKFGDWTLVDGDKGLAGGFFTTYTYPGQGTAFAFEAFNPNAITSDFNVIQQNPGLTPHSGNQFAAAPFVLDPTRTYTMNADNWLISPELSGKKQTIKFYAMNAAGNDDDNNTVVYSENFDVLYSETGSDPADFKKIESDVADGRNLISQNPNWKEITVEIPEGARYFAIHHNTHAGKNFLFGLDDITYTKGWPGANDSIITYNVYRDGRLIGSAKGSELIYLDGAMDGGTHVYNVTAVYQSKDGEINESGFSNDASVTVAGIDSVTANAEGRYDVYTIDGKTVMTGAKSLSGLHRGIYIINDKKYIIK